MKTVNRSMMAVMMALFFSLMVVSNIHSAIIYQCENALPALIGDASDTIRDGDISWFTDATQGRCMQIRCFDHDPGNSAGERAEIAGGDQTTLNEGKTVYVGWKSRLQIVMLSDGGFRTIMQSKMNHGTMDHGIKFDAKSNLLVFEAYNAQDVGNRIWDTPVVNGKWYSVVIKIHYSCNSALGQYQLWLDGVAQKFTNGLTTYTIETLDCSPAFQGANIHWGIYRRVTLNGIDTNYLYHPRIATTFEEADPDAATPAVAFAPASKSLPVTRCVQSFNTIKITSDLYIKRVALYTVRGCVVSPGACRAGVKSIEFSIAGVPSGVYFLTTAYLDREECCRFKIVKPNDLVRY